MVRKTLVSALMTLITAGALVSCTYDGRLDKLDGKVVLFKQVVGLPSLGRACWRVPQAEYDAAYAGERCIVPPGVDCVIETDGAQNVILHELAHCAEGKWH